MTDIVKPTATAAAVRNITTSHESRLLSAYRRFARWTLELVSEPWDWCDYEYPSAELRSIREWSETASAIAAMRGNTRWGSDFAHGSDMLFAVADLANRMLPNTDDAFGSLERVSFIRPVTGHLKLSICDGSKPGAAEPAIAGSFRTINGRKLYFEGVVEPNTRLGVKRQNNIVATEFSQARIHSTVGKGFLISPHRADDWAFDIAKKSEALKISSVADTLTAWATWVFGMANKRLIDSGSPYLFFVTRIDEMPAFSDSEIEEIFSGTGVVGMTVHPINRRTPSGMDMTRFDFTWPGHAKPTSLYLASTFDGKIVSAVL